MPLIAAFLLSFIPAIIYAAIVYWLDRYEKEPKLLLGGVFIWGAVVAAGAAYILNTVAGIGIYFLVSDDALTNIATGSFIAPLTEETLKGLAVLIVFLIFRKEFDSVLDGIVYASITAIGFAATENTLYLYELGYLEDGWEGLWFLFFLRVVLGAWNHASYTAFTGIGLAVSRLNKNNLVRFLAPLAGLGISMFVHFLHNTLAAFGQDLGGLVMLFLVDWLGWLFIFAIILWAIRREKGWIQDQLREEVESGLLTPTQFQAATSAFQRNLITFSALTTGNYRAARRFYRLCIELAYKKHQYARLGEHHSNPAQTITDLRDQIRTISLTARV